MKYPILFILCISVCLHVKGQTRTTRLPDNDEVIQSALQQLYEQVHKLHPKVKFKSHELLIGDTSVKVNAMVEFDGQKQNKWIHAVNFTTMLNTTPLSIGVIGVGNDLEEAASTCVSEWGMVFGVPFCNFLIDNKSVGLSAAKAYPGLMAVRGNLPAGTWLKGDDDMAKKILSKIDALLMQRSENLIALDLNLTIGANGIEDGECRIGDLVYPDMLANIKQLDWPVSPAKYLFRQFYLIKKN